MAPSLCVYLRVGTLEVIDLKDRTFPRFVQIKNVLLTTSFQKSIIVITKNVLRVFIEMRRVSLISTMEEVS